MFDSVAPFLRRDLYSRPPTEIISWDGTYAIAGITIDDILCEGEQNCLIIIYDKYSRVLIYGFVDNEQPLHWQRLHYLLRKRAEKLGPEYVNRVKFGYSDICCEGLKDRRDHWFVKMWPSVETAPFKDMFHAHKMVTGPTSVRGATHDLHANFCRALSAATLQFTEASIKLGVEQYCAKNPGIQAEQARLSVVQENEWRKKMYNFTVPKLESSSQCRTLWAKLKVDEERMRQEAERDGRQYQYYILTAVVGKRRGGDLEMKNFIEHLEKGCYEDPLPPEDMSYPLTESKDDSLVKLGRMRGTSGGESANKQVNSARNKATKLSARLSDAKILLRVTRLNHDKDKKLEYVTGIKAKSTFWYLDEAMEQRIASCGHTSIKVNPNYPPVCDDYDEPIGVEFARQRDWTNIDQFLYHHEVPHFDHMLDEADFCRAALEPARRNAAALTSTSSAGFSAGNTVWNRKEGGKARTPLNKFVVKEKLTDIQEQHLADICVNIQQKHSSSINTLDSYAKMVKVIWDQHHFRELTRGMGGMGGVLPLEIAKSRIKNMTDTAVASRQGPTTFESMFVLSETHGIVQNTFVTPPLPVLPNRVHSVPVHPSQLAQQSTTVAAVLPTILPQWDRNQHARVGVAASTLPPSSNRKRGRPKKGLVRLVPLEELTMAGALALSHVSLKHYTRLINNSAPGDKTKALAIVMDYIDTRR